MKLHQEDPRLTAYLLGELTPEESAVVRTAIAEDAELRRVIDETAQVQSRLMETFGEEKEILLPRHRQKILRAAREAARNGKIQPLKSHPKRMNFWTLPVAAAAVIGGGIFVLTLIPSAGGKGGKKQVATKGRLDSQNVLPGLRREAGNITRLPLEAGKRSLAQISRAIRIEHRVPTIDEVRIEEILNAFPLKAKDSVALFSGSTLGAEILSCPWKPSACLVFVEVQGARDAARKMTVDFRVDGESVLTHRIIGYSASGTGAETRTASTISPGGRNLLVIEIEAKQAHLGTLTWTVDGKDAPPVDLIRDPAKEPSDDARFAALICSFGMWLKGEEKEMVDDSLVLGLARECASDDIVADRYDFLELVDQAVKLK